MSPVGIATPPAMRVVFVTQSTVTIAIGIYGGITIGLPAHRRDPITTG
ncbi:MAG: hypothetical protein HY271_06930 [Deltaproteobacteria bacterium]|nr:hypothetical protein [Deltaproteobacteria bacterium]